MAVMSGGSVALALSVALNGLSASLACTVLVAAGVVMTMVGIVVGLAPAVAAALFAPVVVALSDPSWTLGDTAAALSLSNESWTTFVVFVIAAILGTILRRFTRLRSHGSRRRRAY